MNNTYCGQRMRTRVVSYQTIVEPSPLHECMVQLNDTNVMIYLKGSATMSSGSDHGRGVSDRTPRATASTGLFIHFFIHFMDDLHVINCFPSLVECFF